MMEREETSTSDIGPEFSIDFRQELARAGIFGTAATATAYCGATDPQLNAC
jgi:hypothetical protein